MKENTKKYLPYILATSIFMQMLDSTILNTALHSMAIDMNESALDMQLAILSYILTLALCIPLSGYLCDKYGTKVVFIWALSIFSLGSLLCALSFTLPALAISRVVQGIGAALMTPTARLSLLKTFEKSDVVKAMNYAVVPALIGPILGPLVGGYLVEYVSWHWIFIINIPIGILGIILAAIYMPNYKSTEFHFDLKGFILFGLACLVLSLSVEMLGETSMLSYTIIGLICAILLFIAYRKYAQKATSPLFPLNLFQIRTFRISMFGNVFTRLGISSLPLLIPLMLQSVYGESPTSAGWMVAPLAVAALLNKPVVLPLLNKVGYKKVLIFNTVIIGLLIMTFAIPDLNINKYWFILMTFLLGWFNSTQFTTMNSIGIADLRQYNTSSGNSLLAVNQQMAIGFGVAFGIAILRILESQLGQGTDNLHLAFKWTFIIVGVVTLLSTTIFLKLHITDGDNLRNK